ncbi:MAG TPA: hypothetical protein EYP34_04390, partial [Chromatiaceae bacterium]|nr:hypothetical protein [Chromatiaceae bacterium]
MTIKRTSMLGLEIEMFVLNEQGKLVNGADTILEPIESKRLGKYAKPELSKAQVELIAAAKPSIRDCAVAFTENLAELVGKLRRRDTDCFPWAPTPPGSCPASTARCGMRQRG